MTPLPVGEFLELVRRSNLLTAEQFSVLWQELFVPAVAKRPGPHCSTNAAGPDADVQARSESPRQIADRLVERGWLTRWQADTLLTGHKTFFFGKYRLLECIGTGGMGAVFKARHDRLGRVVALKIMSASFIKDTRAVARFRNEIRAVAALNHPHIVSAYDADYVGSVHFLVMEYVPGHDLGWYAERFARMPIGWTCECIRQAALGLQHAHEQGMVHRDIKPTNLLVTEDSETGGPIAKLLDLGIARFASDVETSDSPRLRQPQKHPGLTQAGQVLGTPDFMSPEQARETRRADARSDIFSLGCTLFRLLTGQMPFPGETVAEKLSARVKGFPRSLRALRPEAPLELDLVLARMLARDPGERYQTAGEVALALVPFALPERFRTGAAPLPASASEAEAALGPASSDGGRLERFFAHLATHAADEAPIRNQHRKRLRRWRRALTRVPIRIWLRLVAALFLGIVLVAFWRWLTRATLLVDLPAGQRADAILDVNGRRYPLEADAETRISGRPGAWRMRLSRPGYELIHATLEFRAGEVRVWAPAWKPARIPRSEAAPANDGRSDGSPPGN